MATASLLAPETSSAAAAALDGLDAALEHPVRPAHAALGICNGSHRHGGNGSHGGGVDGSGSGGDWRKDARLLQMLDRKASHDAAGPSSNDTASPRRLPGRKGRAPHAAEPAHHHLSPGVSWPEAGLLAPELAASVTLDMTVRSLSADLQLQLLHGAALRHHPPSPGGRPAVRRTQTPAQPAASAASVEVDLQDLQDLQVHVGTPAHLQLVEVGAAAMVGWQQPEQASAAALQVAEPPPGAAQLPPLQPLAATLVLQPLAPGEAAQPPLPHSPPQWKPPLPPLQQQPQQQQPQQQQLDERRAEPQPSHAAESAQPEAAALAGRWALQVQHAQAQGLDPSARARAQLGRPAGAQRQQHRAAALAAPRTPQQLGALQRAITRAICCAGGWLELARLVDEQDGQLNHIHVAAMLQRLAQLSEAGPVPRQEQEDYRQLLRHLMRFTDGMLPRMGPRDLPLLLCAAARLQPRTPAKAWAVRLMVRIRPLLTKLTPQGLALTAWALGRWGMRLRPDWSQPFLAAARASLGDAPPQSLALLLQGLVRCRCHPGEHWLGLWLDHAQQRMSGFNGQDLACALWSLATLQVKPPRAWCVHAAEQLVRLLQQQQQPRRLEEQPRQQQQRVQQRQRLHQQQQPPQQQHRQVQQRRQRPPAGGCSDRELATSLWALARIMGRATTAAPAATATAPSTAAAATGAARRAAAAQPPPSPPPPLLRGLPRVLCAAQARLATMGAVEQATLLYSLALLGAAPTPAWMDAFLQRAAEQLPAFDAQGLTSLAYGLALLRVQPPPRWRAAFAAALERRAAAVSPQGWEALSTAYEMLGWRPPPGAAAAATVGGAPPRPPPAGGGRWRAAAAPGAAAARPGRH